jgi:hypothetical protein
VLYLFATTAAVFGVAVFAAARVRTVPVFAQARHASAALTDATPIPFPITPHETPSARAAAPPPAPPATVSAPAPTTERITDADAFRAFGDRAGLDVDQRRTIWHIIELYRANSDALYQIAAGEKLENMQRRLLRDTASQLHVRIPAPFWGDFMNCGLVANLETVVKGKPTAEHG